MATAPVAQEEQKQKEALVYSDEELKYRSFLTDRLQRAFDARNKTYTEFNDMTYAEYWDSNAKAANSYTAPKVNEEDVRVVTGTTEEKEVTLLSNTLNYNLEPDIEAYGKNDEHITELGNNMEDMVRKSRQVERPTYDEKKVVIYKELFDQGTVFVEEQFLEINIPRKKLNKLTWSEVAKIKDIKWEKRLDLVMKYCNSNLITGLNVYLGNIREFFMFYQPFVFTRELRPRAEMEAIYGKWERWQYIPEGISSVQDTTDTEKSYNDWSLEKVSTGMVEVIKYQDKWANDYMIMINGVMMLPIHFPLEALLGTPEYTISKGDVQPISRNFAYSKSVPAKTKVDQAVYDEMLRLVILKTQQSFKPPIANNTGQTLSKRIFYPGAQTANIEPSKIAKLLDSTGVTNAEFNAIQFIKGIIDEKSVSPVFQGQAQSGQQTAREIVELKQASMMKLGLAILGIVNLEKSMVWLRLYNIIQNWTSPVDTAVDKLTNSIQNLYKSVTVDSEFDDGSKGQKIIEFTDKPIPDESQIMAEEKLMSMNTGKKIRKVYLNPEMLQTIVEYWYIEMTPTEKNTNELRRAMFEDMIRSGFEFFGPQAFNQEHLKERWATNANEDPERIFIQQSPMGAPGMPQSGQPMQTSGQPMQGGQGATMNQMSPRQTPNMQSPNSVTNLMNA